jgi:hypothetical protein
VSAAPPTPAAPPTRAGVPAPPGSSAGRARSFRRNRDDSRTSRRERVVEVVLLAAVLIGAYTVATERPGELLAGYGTGGSQTPPGPPIFVHFGTPSVSTVTCGGGGTAYVERIPWTNSTEPVPTGVLYVRVFEIWDGDFIPDSGAVANATATNPCNGTPPDASALWYLVLAAPNGTNLLTYTEAAEWTSVSGGPTHLDVANGSALLLVTSMSLAGTGRGLELVGYVGNSPISGSVAL